ncbi:MAG: glycosyltransferase [Hyphomonadaceae bacterium]|nr:glycosyltransferase [Hyphomonadaceae bacterium]
MAPKISLITPCLNSEATIERTLVSIKRQNYPALEYIVYDGASKDGTVDILRRYEAVGLVTTLVSEPDKSPGDAINKGFARATGDIYCYLNADDAFEDGALEYVAEFFAANPDIDVLTGGCRRVFADSSETITAPPEDFLSTVALRNYFEQPSTFWRAEAHKRAGVFDESYKLAFDWEWWNRLNRSGAKFARTDKVFSVYYFSADNLTSTAGQRVIDEMYRVTKTYAPKNGEIADVYKMLFDVFDMNGFYDKPFAELPPQRQVVLGAALAALYAIYGREAINAYNWNWASKQIRGITWYK